MGVVGLNMSSPALALLFCIVGLAAAQDNCCATMESGGNTYTLSMERADKPNPDCIDGCVYTMGGENFCFAEQPLTAGASNGTCQATPIDCTCGFRVFWVSFWIHKDSQSPAPFSPEQLDFP